LWPLTATLSVAVEYLWRMKAPMKRLKCQGRLVM
jgi:hypothetical protein